MQIEGVVVVGENEAEVEIVVVDQAIEGMMIGIGIEIGIEIDEEKDDPPLENDIFGNRAKN
jgi:hypothetical protein